ncbi:MAG: hypothetical protein WBG37_13355 [Desulfobacterales bacterium]|jgi:glucose-6-phosphate 1-dehydrogenase
MDFHYRNAFKSASIPDAYERLLLDVIQGDASLFARSDEIRQAWQLMDPLIEHWAQASRAPAQYPAGSWGPEEAEALLGREDHQWQMGCSIHDR